jgi:hypothetical protein
MTEDMDIAHEEVFGPVANIIVARDADDALRIANDTTTAFPPPSSPGTPSGAWISRRSWKPAAATSTIPLCTTNPMPLWAA